MTKLPPNWPNHWAMKSWKGSQGSKRWQLLELDLAAAYLAIPEGKAAFCQALGVQALQNRKADRALQLLRKEGLIWYNADTKFWEQSAWRCPAHGPMVQANDGDWFCTACSAEDG